MEKAKHHIFVCCGFRASGAAQGACAKKGSLEYMPYIESELADRDMSDVNVSMTGCLNVCDRGPAMIIYPENYWYGGVDSEDAIDAILDSLEDGEACEDYLLS